MLRFQKLHAGREFLIRKLRTVFPSLSLLPPNFLLFHHLDCKFFEETVLKDVHLTFQQDSYLTDDNNAVLYILSINSPKQT